MSKPNLRNVVVAPILGGVLALSALLPAAAQGTATERMACMSDAMNYCGADIPNEGRIESCLRRNQARISAACQQVLGPSPEMADVVATGSLHRRVAH